MNVKLAFAELHMYIWLDNIPMKPIFVVDTDTLGFFSNFILVPLIVS